MFYHIQSKKVGDFFLMFRWNFLAFSLCLLPLALAVVTTERSPASSLPASHFKMYVNTLMRSLLSLLFLRLNSHSSLSFSSQSRCYLIILVAFCWTHSSSSSSTFYWGAQQWAQYWQHVLFSPYMFLFMLILLIPWKEWISILRKVIFSPCMHTYTSELYCTN